MPGNVPLTQMTDADLRRIIREVLDEAFRERCDKLITFLDEKIKSGKWKA